MVAPKAKFAHTHRMPPSHPISLSSLPVIVVNSSSLFRRCPHVSCSRRERVPCPCMGVSESPLGWIAFAVSARGNALLLAPRGLSGTFEGEAESCSSSVSNLLWWARVLALLAAGVGGSAVFAARRFGLAGASGPSTVHVQATATAAAAVPGAAPVVEHHSIATPRGKIELSEEELASYVPKGPRGAKQ